MTEVQFKKNLNCYGTQWEYNGIIYGSEIFAKTEEEAEEIIKSKRETEKLNGQIRAKYCLNPNEIEEDSLKDYKEFLKDTSTE